MAQWRDENKVLLQKIASLEEYSSKKNKSGNENGKLDLFDLNPSHLPYHEYLVVDFEQAQSNAFIQDFKSSPQGCYFHFHQALCCCLQKYSDLHELINEEETKEAKYVFSCFAAFALVQKEETNSLYDALLCHPYILTIRQPLRPLLSILKLSGLISSKEHTVSKKTVKKPKFSKILIYLKTRQAISACLFKTGMKNKDKTPKQNKGVKKYTEISKVVLVYYPKDRKLMHLQSISVALSTDV
ncbi:hypothetical protein DSO57_1000114 [Entomophthora muscae]|uniref:Uncharacterized protein n=1 Tax=Entomophthora muscae TaxID=34485 RepID=A0ACC2SMS1_9FUNG|nr:hypothetical protein DSO57_1000114 [Entomophthora muscae]